MKVVIQKSKKSNVYINNELYNEIDSGLVILVGFTENDSGEDITYIVNKIVNLRIFNDENHIMNKSILDVGGSILSISQFTLYADTAKGNRPSYVKALAFDQASKLYDIFNKKLSEFVECKTGIFGSDMIINISNDGPTTIIIDSKNK